MMRTITRVGFILATLSLFLAVDMLSAAPQKLATKDLKKGDGKSAENGKKVTVHYTGWLADGDKPGKKFDSSVDNGAPFQFILGNGQVIKGWDEGVKGMKIGGKRKLTIPADLGYGKRGAPPDIPPDATLIFEVELLAVD